LFLVFILTCPRLSESSPVCASKKAAPMRPIFFLIANDSINIQRNVQTKRLCSGPPLQFGESRWVFGAKNGWMPDRA